MSDTHESDLPELPTEALPELPREAAPDLASAPAPSLDPPGLREMHGAPLHLRTATLVCIAGCLIPWLSYSPVAGPVSWGVGKAITLLGIWLLWKSIDLRHGDAVPGFVSSLGGILLNKPKEVDPKMAARRAARQTGPTRLEVPFPTALHIVALLLVVVGCIVPLFDPQKTGDWYRASAEICMLAWAAGTWVHIYAYERWGHFNPIFPLMFVGMLFAGGLNVVGYFQGNGNVGSLGVLGGLIVAVGGGMAAYTIVEAMLEAKKEGDAKKAAEMDRRRAARGKKDS